MVNETCLPVNLVKGRGVNVSQRYQYKYLPRPGGIENITEVAPGARIFYHRSWYYRGDQVHFSCSEKFGFKNENIYTTLENRSKRGVGKCSRCNVGKLYICKDGPVFTKPN